MLAPLRSERGPRMNDFPWLTAIALLPLLGAAIAAILPARPGDVLPKQIALGASWHDADDRSTKAFFAWVLALEGLALAVFMAQDVFLFYVVFEATLIPAY